MDGACGGDWRKEGEREEQEVEQKEKVHGQKDLEREEGRSDGLGESGMRSRERVIHQETWWSGVTYVCAIWRLLPDHESARVYIAGPLVPAETTTR